MSRACVYALVCVLLLLIEVGLLSGLPWPLPLLPLVPTAAIWLYHTWHSSIGVWFLLAWGVAIGWLQLMPWVSPMAISVALIVFALLWVDRLFTHRSLWGLLATVFVGMMVWTALEGASRLLSGEDRESAFLHFGSDAGFRTVLAILFATFLFYLEGRVRRLRLRL